MAPVPKRDIHLGLGIPPDRLAGIFDLYTQAAGPDSRSTNGLGIGLALVRQLVQLHKGAIPGRSEGRGQGRAFTVKLPRAL